ncbi:MAG: hypothetical protein BZ138_06415 [Methanosphaera sp. rholeuAM270]|nr:MAG: hypothetical protein BZ138_06415 [Methanosphaera sp. rholeuAM270]
MAFEKYTELFDSSDGGPVYVAEFDGSYGVAGVLWLDGGSNGLHYFAFEMEIDDDTEIDGILVCDKYSAADAFSYATDPYVSHEVGWFANMDEALAAIDAHIEHRNSRLA